VCNSLADFSLRSDSYWLVEEVEITLAELKQRIREVKPGPNGCIYAITDETFGAVLRIEPPLTN